MGCFSCMKGAGGAKTEALWSAPHSRLPPLCFTDFQRPAQMKPAQAAINLIAK